MADSGIFTTITSSIDLAQRLVKGDKLHGWFRAMETSGNRLQVLLEAERRGKNHTSLDPRIVLVGYYRDDRGKNQKDRHELMIQETDRSLSPYVARSFLADGIVPDIDRYWLLYFTLTSGHGDSCQFALIPNAERQSTLLTGLLREIAELIDRILGKNGDDWARVEKRNHVLLASQERRQVPRSDGDDVEAAPTEPESRQRAFQRNR